ncbi:MAG TPA: hypothetical protein VK871_10150 [Candidatus Limnocylindrales bacterium]|nr:hypothetical protein [Candidatus Limnocylindrales bacterium]
MDGPTPQPGPEPGERRRTLDRPPGERYLARESAQAAAGPTSSPIVRGAAIALAGALVITFLGGPLSVTAGLLVAAALIGWLVGSVVRPALVPALVLSVGSVALGLVGVWLFARLEGGVLGPLDYLGEVQGPLAPLQLVVAGVVAFATIR